MKVKFSFSMCNGAPPREALPPSFRKIYLALRVAHEHSQRSGFYDVIVIYVFLTWTLRDVSCTFLEALCRSVEDLEWLLLSVDVRSSELQRNILINGDWSPQLLESDGRSYVMPSDLCTALPLLGSMQPKCQQPKTNIDLGPRSPLVLWNDPSVKLYNNGEVPC